MRDVAIPDLTFPMVEYGQYETRWDLRALLYRGAANANVRTVFNRMAAGDFGRPLVERLELVKRIHAAMADLKKQRDAAVGKLADADLRIVELTERLADAQARLDQLQPSGRVLNLSE